jgi:L-methionine (R)-S-oxide reductase
MHIDFHPTPSNNKEEVYGHVLASLRALTAGERDVVANMANTTALLHESFRFWWVGFYLVRDGELVLGPFQGPLACTRIPRGKGVCGAAWEREATVIVPDVELFPGHIACSAASRSEIVVPLMRDGVVIGVLDVDSEHLDYFDVTDQAFLEQICAVLVAGSNF